MLNKILCVAVLCVVNFLPSVIMAQNPTNDGISLNCAQKFESSNELPVMEQLSRIQRSHRIDALNESIHFLTARLSENIQPKDKDYFRYQISLLQQELDSVLKYGILFNENPLFDVDSYKVSQYRQYHPHLTQIFSYLEARSNAKVNFDLNPGAYEKTVFFGLQYVLKKYFSKPITMEMVHQAKPLLEKHGVPFNEEGWKFIVNQLGGRLPIRIHAVAEGSVVPTKNILMSIESTHEKCAWVVGWLETQLMRLWYPITVATTSYEIYNTIYDFLVKSSDDPDAEILFKLQDFGARGVSSPESAKMGGAAHLTSFYGTDTVIALPMLREYYHEEMAGFSLPASEHSTMTSWGGVLGEPKAMENMVNEFAKPGQSFAIVADSYDLWNAVSNIIGTQLKAKIIRSGATLIVRPDSGNPAEIVLKTIQLLEEKFGSFVNSKGYRVLNHVRVIQGDGINHGSVIEILNVLLRHGYSATNISFGMGGALLQLVNRDIFGFAFKASSGTIDGKLIEIFKDPVTSNGTKRSKRGLLDLIIQDGNYVTVKGPRRADSVLQPVYENGILLIDESFSAIRNRTREHRKMSSK